MSARFEPCMICGEEARMRLSMELAIFGPMSETWELCAEHGRSLMQWNKDQRDLAVIPIAQPNQEGMKG